MAHNPAVEVLSSDPAVGSLHRRLILALGTCLGELWDFETVAQRCAEEGRHEMWCDFGTPQSHRRSRLASQRHRHALTLSQALRLTPHC